MLQMTAFANFIFNLVIIMPCYTCLLWSSFIFNLEIVMVWYKWLFSVNFVFNQTSLCTATSDCFVHFYISFFFNIMIPIANQKPGFLYKV